MPTGRERPALTDPVVLAPPVLDLATRDAWLAEVTDALIPAGATRLQVVMSGLQFVDAAGLGALVLARRRCAQTGAELVLVDTPAHALRLLAITGLDRALTLEPVGSACVAAVPPGAAGGR